MREKERQPYDGFPPELPDFLWGLALNNEKPWFEAHKQQYERCLHEPMMALAWQVRDMLEERMPGLAPELHLSRIYRDARRLYGRGPYNDHLWFSLGKTGRLYDPQPKFWFGIDAKCYDYGAGIWCSGGEIMERWRKRIDMDPEGLERVVAEISKVEGVERYGEVYKRPKGDPGPALYDWYNAKEVGVARTVWFDPDPPGPELARELTEAFCQLEPLYSYLLSL